jgi:hypothetical protein
MFPSLSTFFKPLLCLSWSVVALVLHPVFIHAMERQAKDYGTLTLYFENDTFFNSDYLYTNGFKLSWTSADLENYRDQSTMGAWTHSLIANQPFAMDQEDSHFVSISFGQNIYTPEDTQSSGVVEGERPYAGLLYLSLGYSARSSKRSHAWEMILGVVGPSTFAEDAQGATHDVLGQDKPQGWDNQLDDEPVLNLYYEHKWKAMRTGQWAGLGVDLNTNLGAALGNLYIGALGGVQVRLGWRLPNDFGTSVIRPGLDTNAPMDKDDPRFNKPLNRFGAHLFCGVEGIYVIRDMTLDGNTFTSSHSVEKEPLVGTLSFGIGVTLHRFKIALAHVYTSKEYKTQSNNSEWGSITLSYIY